MTPEEVRRKRFRIRRFRRGINADEVYEYLDVVAAAIDAALAEARAARVEKDRVTDGLRRWQSQFTPDPTTHQPVPMAVPRHAVSEDALRSPAWSVATASYPASGRYRVQSHE